MVGYPLSKRGETTLLIPQTTLHGEPNTIFSRLKEVNVNYLHTYLGEMGRTRKCYDHTAQTNLRHHEEETQNTNNHMTTREH